MGRRTRARRRRARLIAVFGVTAATLAVMAAVVILGPWGAGQADRAAQPSAITDRRTANPALPTGPASYLGVYGPGAPTSYAGVASFTKATGVTPNIVSYYSGWWEPFWTSFAIMATRHHAVPLVQLNPTRTSVTAIASGYYDNYLKSYAEAIRSYRQPVILSFGHEMNGDWYSWGYQHTAPTTFVAAWRHIVKIFRAVGASNVTWMWTVNSVYLGHDLIPDPAAWWPGRSYVNWVGIDGYFHEASARFASVFGPTIVDVRELTNDPILISETGAGPKTGQAAKIGSLFAGVRSYGLLGFVWFDAIGNANYRVDNPAAIDAFSRDAKTYSMPSN
jgi:mannan endo-1,4-beta-mannosidase